MRPEYRTRQAGRRPAPRLTHQQSGHGSKHETRMRTVHRSVSSMTNRTSILRRRHSLWGEDKAARDNHGAAAPADKRFSDCHRYNRPGPFDKSIVSRAAVSTGISGIGRVGEQPHGIVATGSIVMPRTRGTNGTIATAFPFRGPGRRPAAKDPDDLDLLSLPRLARVLPGGLPGAASSLFAAPSPGLAARRRRLLRAPIATNLAKGGGWAVVSTATGRFVWHLSRLCFLLAQRMNRSR